MNIDREIQAYLKKIKLLLPAYGSSERAFLTDLSGQIYDAVQESPNITIKDIEARFGTPVEISQCYIASLDTEVLLSRLSVIRIVRRIFMVVLICGVLGVSIFTVFLHKAYLDSRDTVVTEVETTTDD